MVSLMPHELHEQSGSGHEAFDLTFEEYPEYFFACVEGNSSDPIVINEYQSAIAAEISKRKYNRVMIKRDIPLSNNAAEHFALIYKVRAWEIRRIKYAFVDVALDHLSNYKFALLFGKSCGIDAEVFGDIDSAKEWLLSA